MHLGYNVAENQNYGLGFAGVRIEQLFPESKTVRSLTKEDSDIESLQTDDRTSISDIDFRSETSYDRDEDDRFEKENFVFPEDRTIFLRTFDGIGEQDEHDLEGPFARASLAAMYPTRVMEIVKCNIGFIVSTLQTFVNQSCFSCSVGYDLVPMDASILKKEDEEFFTGKPPGR